jgi:hypothetical protein
MLRPMGLTMQRAILGAIAVLVIASLVVDLLVFGAAGHALNPDLYQHVKPLDPAIDLYLR